MRDIFRLFPHILACIIKTLRHSGVKSIAAQNLILQKQCILVKRTRKRAPRLTEADRTSFAILAQIIPLERLKQLAILAKKITILKFHGAQVKRKYCLLYCARSPGKPGHKGPEPGLIQVAAPCKKCVARNPTRQFVGGAC